MTSARPWRPGTQVPVHFPAIAQVLEAPWERQLEPSSEDADASGERFRAVIRVLATNGAELTAHTIPPLLSRLVLSFELPEHEPAVAFAVVVWRRTTHFMPPPARKDVAHRALSPGFGVAFEAVDDEVRAFVTDMERQASRGT